MTDLGLCNDALFDSAILHKMCFFSCFIVICARINLFDMYPKTANRVHV